MGTEGKGDKGPLRDIRARLHGEQRHERRKKDQARPTFPLCRSMYKRRLSECSTSSLLSESKMRVQAMFCKGKVG